jgi:Spy/CpxP family protein refolding chaperone
VQTILRTRLLPKPSRNSVHRAVLKINVHQIRSLRGQAKRTALIIAALACAHNAPVVAATDPTTEVADTQRQLSDIAQKLQLTSHQSMQLRALMTNLNDQLRMLRRTYGATLSATDRDDAVRRANALEQAFQGQMLGILRADQRGAWEPIREAYRAAAINELLADG